MAKIRREVTVTTYYGDRFRPSGRSRKLFVYDDASAPVVYGRLMALQELRGLIMADGRIVVWDAYQEVHEDVEIALLDQGEEPRIRDFQVYLDDDLEMYVAGDPSIQEHRGIRQLLDYGFHYRTWKQYYDFRKKDASSK